MDFEHQPANHLAFRLASTILLPSCARVRWAAPTRSDAGEDPLLPGPEGGDLSCRLPTRPEPPRAPRDRARRWGASRGRPPRARYAAYHSFENPLFFDCVTAVLRDPRRATMVVLPRHARAARAFEEQRLPRCFVARAGTRQPIPAEHADLISGPGGR